MKKSVSDKNYKIPLTIALIAMALAAILLFVPMVTATAEAAAKFTEDEHPELINVSLYSFKIIYFYMTGSDIFSHGLVLVVVLSLTAFVLAAYKKWLAAILCEAPVVALVNFGAYIVLATCLNEKYIYGPAFYVYPVVLAAIIVGLVWFAIAVPKKKKEKKIKNK